jgi:hypothetical protein
MLKSRGWICVVIMGVVAPAQMAAGRVANAARCKLSSLKRQHETYQ